MRDLKNVDRSLTDTIRKRVEKILMNFMELNGINKPLMYIVSKVVINKLASNKIQDIIIKSLRECKLL